MFNLFKRKVSRSVQNNHTSKSVQQGKYQLTPEQIEEIVRRQMEEKKKKK